jgi:Co/Zn/Cd efflux system component
LGQHCCSHETKSGSIDPQWRRALWIALVINAGMFLVEMVAGAAADSRALYADALDFFSDAANYAISLGVAGLALVWRARAALFKGATLLVLGLWVIIACLWAIRVGSMPEALPMGAVGILALAANVFVALMLYRFRTGDANMQSVWICSRNDAIGNIAVVAAAIGVFGTGTAWPDLAVATIMAALGISGGWSILRLARAELRGEKERRVSPA